MRRLTGIEEASIKPPVNPLVEEARNVSSGGIGLTPISDLVGGLLAALESAERRAEEVRKEKDTALDMLSQRIYRLGPNGETEVVKCERCAALRAHLPALQDTLHTYGRLMEAVRTMARNRHWKLSSDAEEALAHAEATEKENRPSLAALVRELEEGVS